MKKFSYRAQTYLKVVKNDRDQALIELRDAEKKCSEIKELILLLGEKMKEARDKNSRFGKNTDSIYYINDNNSFIARLKKSDGIFGSGFREGRRDL